MEKPLLKVLILENNQKDAELVIASLMKGEWEIVSKIVLEESSYKNELNAFDPDIILSNYKLCESHTIDALNLAIAKNPLTPFIIIFGPPDKQLANECIKKGAWDYIFKDHLERLCTSVSFTLECKEKKEVQKKLQLSEQRLLMALDGSNDGLWDWNTETGNVYFSDGFFSMLGYKPEEYDHDFALFFRLVHPDDEEILERQIIKTLRGQDQNLKMEIRLRKKNGNYAWILSRGKVFEKKTNDSPLRIVGTNVDVSDRKKQEITQAVLFEIANSVISTRNLNELFESIQKSLHRVVDTKNCYVALYDEKTDALSLPYHRDEKDSFTEFPAGKSLTGYVIKSGKAQLVDDKKIIELEKEGSIEPLGADSSSWLGVPLKIGGKIIGVYVVQSYDESIFYTPEDVSILEFVSDQIALAIERKIDQDNIHANQAKQRRIFESLPDGLVVIDTSGEIIDFNSYFWQLLRLSPVKLKKKSLYDFIVEDDRLRIKNIIKETIVTGFKKNIEFRMRKSDGEEFFAEMSLGVMHSGKGKAESFVIVVKNINERKAYESNLKIAKEKAEESDMLKSAFLSNMSHEIRTPMNAIIGFAELLSVKSIPDSEKDEFIQQINIGADTLMHLIDDIIDISKIEAGQLKINKTSFEISSVFAELHSMFSKSLIRLNKTNVRLVEDHNGFSPAHQLFADEFRIKQILTNLISNAIKFTDQGEVRYGIKSIQNGEVVFFVRDTGIGVEKSKQEIIFDRFRQGHETNTRFYGGTGLGLAISKNLTEMMGGKIRVESEKGKGSEFIFSVPYEDSSPGSYDQEIPDVRVHDNFSGKLILIVEDEESNYQFLNEVLKKSGANILHANDGIDAMEIFENNPSIDLILMDIQIPKKNGYEVTREIKKRRKDIPIIAQTAYAMAGEREKSVEAGCDDYIAKPIKIHELMFILKKHLGN